MLIPYIEQVHLGVFIPNRKLHTEPMKQLGRYLKSKGYSVYYFEDAYREETPVDAWPHVDVILSFFSEGIDFMKIKKYAEMHCPVEINRIDAQFLLLDRRAVMAILDKIEVPTAFRIIYNGRAKDTLSEYKPRASTARAVEAEEAQKPEAENDTRGKTKTKVEERQEEMKNENGAETEIDRIVKKELISFNIMRDELLKPSRTRYCKDGVLCIDDKKMKKPYVEKPAYSEDHNINIYYSNDCKNREGGVCRLFRKIGSKSSNFDKNTQGVSYREDGSYIYEKYLEMKDYLDIKVYVLGKKVYAETRKSPVKDGIVIRTKSGKEERKEIELTEEEISAVVNISRALGQFICGMDILRTSDGRFIVVDVNGWSFVKSNPKYYTQTYLKFLDKKIKKEVLRKRAVLGDSSRREDVKLYSRIVEIISEDASKELKKEEVLRLENSSEEKQNKTVESADDALSLVNSSKNAIEIKGVHAVYRHARRTPKLKKRLIFVSEYLLEYVGNDSHVAGRDTSRVKEIERLLEKENKNNPAFRTSENLLALESLKEITQGNTDVRVKITSEGNIARLILKWGGLLTELSKKEIEYEAMEYESFISTVEGDSFSTGTLYSPTKPISERKTERKIRIIANPEDRTQNTAEIFKTVFQWTGRVQGQIKEKYFSTSRTSEEISDKLCARLASAYAMLKEEMLYRESSNKLTIEPITAPSAGLHHSCIDGSEVEISSLYRNKLTVKVQSKKKPEGSSVSDSCSCCSLDCECKEIHFLKRWCFVFNEYPLLTPKNTKTVIPLLLDFIDYDILSSQYRTAPSPVFKYFKNIEDVFLLFNTHASYLYKKRIDTFFNENKTLDIVSYMHERIASQLDTIYITKKFTVLVLLKYILSIEDAVYINKPLKVKIEEIMHSIGFLSSITLMHLSCKGVEYILVKYSHGIHINNKINRKTETSPEQILRADRKKILAVIRKSAFFKDYTK
ncbi:inositol-hexakisphosphate/diphosphoinositol-pentakisphosphate 1-kinase [Nematocida minor]|uniref:inositol-hexakisphosphate/diphosphoinositol- pentakisphosphate 1-kinase n=1 Tax=Nematocida minor TaxID=1912983 RepID=UPI00221F2530|nr:inositol-hexakisphosphate/diphosphoinositol-pentakisphosphate 1-kinase [Nematocida minor]KAI5189450.1 inositol-hexakisphosphate/diphosphoinositol-pentakisphosphate 1-kinase [Nematocida minor]